MGTARYVYNKTVEYLRQEGTKANYIKVRGQIFDSLPEWAKEIPYQVKLIAVRDACQAVTNAKLKYKKTGVFNQVSFRSKKAPRQSIFIPKTSLNSTGVYPMILGKMKFSESIKEVKHDCRVVLEDGYRWYVVIPVENKKVETPRNKENTISLDPGVRTFLTGYCQHGIIEIGKGSFERIVKVCLEMDKIQRKMTKVRARRRQNLKRAWRRLKHRVECLKSELLWKSATFLAKSFDTIIIPSFCATDMAKKTKRKINSKTVRAMMNLAHSRFRNILEWQCGKYGSRVLSVSEEYTSKTCPLCGSVHNKLGGSKEFKCPQCRYKAPRDANGAFNILLKAMVDSPTLSKQGVTVNFC